MRKFIVAIVLTLILATTSWAAPVNSGTITNLDGLTLNGSSGKWTTGTLEWRVNSNTNNTWTYLYTFSNYGTANNQKVSYIDLEVRNGFSIVSNLVSSSVAPDTTAPSGPATYNGLYGLQWDFADTKGPTAVTLTLITNTAPMWGDIFIGGNDANTFAKNSGFGLDNPNAITGNSSFVNNGKTYYSVLVPTPIPAAAWMLGAGLVGLLAIRRRKS